MTTEMPEVRCIYIWHNIFTDWNSAFLAFDIDYWSIHWFGYNSLPVDRCNLFVIFYYSRFKNALRLSLRNRNLKGKWPSGLSFTFKNGDLARGLKRWYLVLGSVAVCRGFKPQSDLELFSAKIIDSYTSRSKADYSTYNITDRIVNASDWKFNKYMSNV
jgi:hypothetical protein